MPICSNKNAQRNYHLTDRYEAGIVLTGTEVKSIRKGDVNINDAYAAFENSELFLVQMHISPYSHGNRSNHVPLRKRKLLLHKRELGKLIGSVVEKGLTLVPVQLYWKKGNVKVELALGKGKNKGDKREDIKSRDAEREIAGVLKKSKY